MPKDDARRKKSAGITSGVRQPRWLLQMDRLLVMEGGNPPLLDVNLSIRFWKLAKTHVEGKEGVATPQITNGPAFSNDKIYEFWSVPRPFTRTCACRMAHRLRQISIIFRRLEFLLAHGWSKWTSPEAGNSNSYILFCAFNIQSLIFSRRQHYKFGYDLRCITMVLR